MAFTNKEPETIRVNQVYKDNDTGTEVVPFFLDNLRGLVRFAPLGRSREEETKQSEFMANYTYVGVQSANAERPKSESKRASEDKK